MANALLSRIFVSTCPSGSTYTMRDDLLRINQVHTRRTVPGGNRVRVLVPNLWGFYDNSDISIRRDRKGSGVACRHLKFPNLKLF